MTERMLENITIAMAVGVVLLGILFIWAGLVAQP